MRKISENLCHYLNSINEKDFIEIEIPHSFSHILFRTQGNTTERFRSLQTAGPNGCVCVCVCVRTNTCLRAIIFAYV